MPESYAQREESYRRRLLAIIPIAVGLVGLLFVTSDVVPYDNLRRVVGWEGPMQILPQVTIIPDKDPREDTREESVRQTMAAMDLQLHEETGPAKGFPEPEVPTKKPAKVTTPELDIADIRHYPAHTEVPYSEDFVILHMVQPEYPPIELHEGIEGDVTIEILVNEEGNVENAWVLTAVGPKSFEHASLAAVRQFRFKPPVANGKPMPMWIRFQVRFRLV